MQIQDLMSSMLDRYSQIKHSNNERNKDIFESLIGVSADCQTETELNSDSKIESNSVKDNGVKSAVFLACQLEEQKSTGATTVIKLTEEEKLQWKGENLPEGIRFCNAGGGIYTADAKLDYQFAALYDENPLENNPVIYLKMSAVTADSTHYKDFIDCKEIVKVEVNKVDPSNATYEEMIALAAYVYRDDPMAASEACDAVDMAREYM